MKKLLIFMAIFSAFTTAAFAKTWTNNVGVGFNIPASKITFSKSGVEDVYQGGFGLDSFYLGYHKNGFCVKGDLDIGVSSSKDISDDDDTDTGVYVNFSFGPGYAFVHNKNMVFALTGKIGCDISSYKYSYKTTLWSTSTENDITTTFASLTLGGDLYFAYHPDKNFGFFADLGVYFRPTGDATVENEITVKSGSSTTTDSTSKTISINGVYRISPSIGLVWRF